MGVPPNHHPFVVGIFHETVTIQASDRGTPMTMVAPPCRSTVNPRSWAEHGPRVVEMMQC